MIKKTSLKILSQEQKTLIICSTAIQNRLKLDFAHLLNGHFFLFATVILISASSTTGCIKAIDYMQSITASWSRPVMCKKWYQI